MRRKKQPAKAPKKVCSVADCPYSQKHIIKGLCAAHYQQQRRGPNLGPCKTRKCGGRIYSKGDGKHCWGCWRKENVLESVSDKGYRLVRDDTGKLVPEHRLVMEKELGRKLLPGETVKHLNDDRLDNRPQNLELWSTSHPAGQSVTELVRWARELLKLYG